MPEHPPATPASQLAEHHQLHGVQPQLPVTDVAAAAAWFRDVLGFEIDLLYGEPPRHARVRVGQMGPEGWGQPIYIHLAHHEGPVTRCGETRLHVGHDIDGLHASVLARGATVLQAPTDQPWGLREMLLEGPDGHWLRLGAETAPHPA